MVVGARLRSAPHRPLPPCSETIVINAAAPMMLSMVSIDRRGLRDRLGD
jgi:hypothetical protein